MSRRESGGGGMGAGGMMAPVFSIASGLLCFVVLIIFAPTIAGAIEAGQPAQAPDSLWNNTCRTALGLTRIPSGTDTWIANIQILGVVVLIISIAVAMYYLKGMA